MRRHDSQPGLLGPFLLTRLVHFHAAIWHNLSPPLTTYLAQRNADPKPYKWKAKGAEILEKIKRARAALDREAVS